MGNEGEKKKNNKASNGPRQCTCFPMVGEWYYTCNTGGMPANMDCPLAVRGILESSGVTLKNYPTLCLIMLYSRLKE